MLIPCKGTSFSIQAANTWTAIAQIISMELPDVSAETYEADTLDNNSAGIPKKPTGRTDGGKLTAELFLDYNATSHKIVTAKLTSPLNTTAPQNTTNCKITFADGANTNCTFAAAGFSLGGTVALKEGLKGKLSAELDGIPTFPT